MSLESANALINRMKSDQNLSTKIHELKNDEDVLAYAASMGFDLTKEDLPLLQNLLSDSDLEFVVGGTGWKDNSDVTGGIKN